MDRHVDSWLGRVNRLPARQRLIAVAAGTVLVTAVGGVAWAASGTPTPNSSGGSSSPGTTTAPSGPGRGFGHGWGEHGGMPGMAMAGAVHGQFTVPKSGGGYETLATQRGTATAVSSGSITVKSADGFSQTYTVTSTTLVNAEAAGITSIKVNDTVMITATVSGNTETAVSINDPSLQTSARKPWAPQWSRPGRSAPNAPTPNGGSSSSGSNGSGAAAFLGTV